jgi:hypothetical protein
MAKRGAQRDAKGRIPRARVAWVRAEYHNQLDYSGFWHCAPCHAHRQHVDSCRIARLFHGPLSHCPIVPVSMDPLSRCPIVPLRHCAIVPLSHCHTAQLAISRSLHGRIVLSSHSLCNCPPRCSIALPALPTSSSLNVPDDCVCYIDDVVIPVSRSDEARNNKLYLDIQITETFHRYHVLTLPSKKLRGGDTGGGAADCLV